MSNKIKIFTLSDNPMFASGVGTQTRYFCEALVKSGKFSIFSIGGQATPVKEEKVYKIMDDWFMLPVQGFGNRELLQTLMRRNKPDIIWFMTDPRFWEWLWLQDREIRTFVPMVYYHVWDNYPVPYFNKPFYESNDYIFNMSKVTQDIVEKVSPEIPSKYIPLVVDNNIFKKLPEEEVNKFVENSIPRVKNKFVIFWNNRNGQRKLAATLLYWYKDFIKQIGRDDKTVLIMNTNPKDEVGTDLDAVIHELGLNLGQVLISPGQQLSMEDLAVLYNVADVTVNISHSEGFGLGTLESLSCETPIIVNKTGGLQEQVVDGVNGYGLEPISKIVVGSLTVPYIYQDYCSKEDFIQSLMKLYTMPKEEREVMGKAGREYVLENYNFEKVCNNWVEVMEGIYENEGSWETRKNFKPYNVIEF